MRAADLFEPIHADSRTDTAVTKPSSCPSCGGRVVDTLAKVITAATCWRCRGCEHTWTIGSAAKGRSPVR